MSEHTGCDTSAWRMLHRVREIAALGDVYSKPYQLRDRLDLIRSLIDVAMAEHVEDRNRARGLAASSQTDETL